MKHVLFIITVLFAFGCAHHRDVRPGTNGVHKVSVNAVEGEDAERSALDQAQHYCQEVHKLNAAIIEEKTSYKGEMDESTRKTVRKASKAAKVIGGSVGVFGGDEGTRTGGAVVGGAGTVGSIMTSGKDYSTEMKFKCQ